MSRTGRKVSLFALGASAVAIIAMSTPAQAQVKPLQGTISPFHGAINPFQGTISPFYGSISAFWGTVSPFQGTISPFWGTVSPFWGVSSGSTLAYNEIGSYWENFGSYWKATQPLWSDPAKAGELGTKMSTMLAQTEQFWGAAVKNKTGKTFADGFTNPLLSRYGISLSDPKTLQALTSDQQSQFFLDWHDSLMRHAGIDHVDHWMRTINWTPSLTLQQGEGKRSVIGLLDGAPTGDSDVEDNISYKAGYTTTVGGHGVGVASLLVAAHDTKGVMGLAPKAKLANYNPFDSTHTASWNDVKDGVLALASKAGATIINMSLGVPGYTLHPDWRKVLSNSQLWETTRNQTVFVLAAGNDGKAQADNILWDYSKDPGIIIVGSVDPTGTISKFSNTPGTACLLNGETCREQLANRFIVAPGELMLVADGKNDIVRRSGTSFAAPLVSGAIALLHDRWPWLAKHPKETVNIILGSAKDLGAAGTDPVYGRGLLDVTAAQSPLSFGALKFYEVRGGVQTERSAADLRAGGVPTTWEAEGVYFHLYETIGATYRDFVVPMSSMLVGKVGTLSGDNAYFQRFITSRMTDWIKGAGAFTDVARSELVTPDGLRLSFSATSPAELRPGEIGHSAMRISNPETGLALSAGVGEGAMMLGGQQGFGLTSDYGGQGGLNPILSLASGGAFAGLDLPLGARTTVSLGTTRQAQRHAHARHGEQAEAYRGVADPRADAWSLRVAHRLDRLSLSAAVARVHESNGLLGVQSRQKGQLDGATSSTATLGASLELGSLALAGSATLGRTQAGADYGFATAGAVLSSAFALSATKQGVLGTADMLRVSLAQPLHIEKGKLAYTGVEVVNRDTGALGLVTRHFGIKDKSRAYAGELIYATPVRLGEASLFSRAETGDEASFVAGARLRLSF